MSEMVGSANIRWFYYKLLSCSSLANVVLTLLNSKSSVIIYTFVEHFSNNKQHQMH